MFADPANLFSINSENGEIQIANMIDRESLTTSVILLKVRVSIVNINIILN